MDADNLVKENEAFFNKNENRVEPVEYNPFAPKLLPMSSE